MKAAIVDSGYYPASSFHGLVTSIIRVQALGTADVCPAVPISFNVEHDMSTPILEMKNISKIFPGVKALSDVTFSVAQAGDPLPRR